MFGTKWTADQIEFLRVKHATHTADWIGRKIGKTKAAVLQKAHSLGLRRTRPRNWWRREFLPFLQEHVAAGKLDAEIAAKWNAQRAAAPALPALDRRTVAYYRKSAGFQVPAATVERRRAVKRAAHRRQLEVLGAKSFADLYRRRVRRDAIHAGWPLDCSRFEVRVLNLLADGRRWTRYELSEALGVDRDVHQRKRLQTGKGSGSVLGNLIRRGLVAKSQGRPVGGKGKGNTYCQYWLTLTAVQYHQRATRRRCG